MEIIIIIVLIIIVLYFGSNPEQRDIKKYPSNPNPEAHNFLSTSFLEYESDPLIDFQHMKKQYMDSIQWDIKRKKRLALDNYTCQSCGVTGVPLDVHHTKGYDLIPLEPLSCLVSLCRQCHEKEHELHGFPQTYEEYMTWDNPITKRR